MGEAKQRKAAIEAQKLANEAWLQQLSAAERTLADVALRTHTAIVERAGLTEGCYHLAMFLNR